jgi:iron(III) transport system substrate-binding protein
LQRGHKLPIRKIPAATLCVCLAISACGNETPVSEEEPQVEATRQDVVVYASVSAAQISPVLEAFTAATGKRYQLVVDDYAGLVRRFEIHGGDPPADLLIASSLAELSAAVEADYFRPSNLDVARNDTPGNLLDPDRSWQPLGVRARIVVYNPTLVSADALLNIHNYASLAENEWRDRLCISSSRVPGNLSLIALLIHDHGEREAELIVRAWRASLADRFFKSDIELLQAVAAGECELAIADTSALATVVAADRDAMLAAHRFAEHVPVLIDISGAGVTRHANNPDGAAELLEWLNSENANALYAASGYEYPTYSGARPATPLQQWSDFVADPMPISRLAYLHQEAVLLAERARYP